LAVMLRIPARAAASMINGVDIPVDGGYTMG
jgi:hypothetical protein